LNPRATLNQGGHSDDKNELHGMTPVVDRMEITMTGVGFSNGDFRNPAADVASLRRFQNSSTPFVILSRDGESQALINKLKRAD
jgi:hypothetical protein